MKVAIYARYSSDQQRDESVEDQIAVCQALIVRHGWSFASAYSDRAMSGSSHLRPSYQSLLSDARSGKFDVVVAEALDRVSRDQEHVAAFFKQMQFCGIRVETVAEGEISELHVGLKGTMNALFIRDLAAKTHRGLRGRVVAGRSAGGNCYGYRVRRETDLNGEAVRGGRDIDPGEAEVVRRIFSAFAAGASPNAIAKMLNREGIAGPGGRSWGDTTIRGHAGRKNGILRNELYAGQRVWNRQRFVKDPQTGKRLARLNPPEHWISEKVPALRIVDGDLWEAVQRKLDEVAASPRSVASRTGRFWEKRRPLHLLTGLVRCHDCGGTFQPIGRDYLRCSSAHRNGACQNRLSVRRGPLEAFVLKGLQERLMAPELVEEFIREFHAELNRAAAGQAAQHAASARKLQAVDRQIDALVTAIANGMNSPSVAARLTALEAERAKLEHTHTTSQAPSIRMHPNLAGLYRQKVEMLKGALEEEETHHEALTILRSLIEAVVVHTTDSGYEIELVGEIASMVGTALGADNKKTAPGRAALSTDDIRSVKLVAGAGFEPTTFRL